MKEEKIKDVFSKNRINIYIPDEILPIYKELKIKLKEKDSSISNEIQNFIKELYERI